MGLLFTSNNQPFCHRRFPKQAHQFIRRPQTAADEDAVRDHSLRYFILLDPQVMNGWKNNSNIRKTICSFWRVYFNSFSNIMYRRFGWRLAGTLPNRLWWFMVRNDRLLPQVTEKLYKSLISVAKFELIQGMGGHIPAFHSQLSGLFARILDHPH